MSINFRMIAVVCPLLLCLALASTAQAVVITASTSGPTTVTPGTPVTIDLSVSGWTDGEVDEVGFIMNFNQLVFSHSGSAVPPFSDITTTGSWLDDGNQQVGATFVGTPDVSNVAGGSWGLTLSDAALSGGGDSGTGATQAAGPLGSAQFTALAPGSSLFEPDVNSVSFLRPFNLLGPFFGTPITPSSLTVQGVTITVVPEPSSFLCLALAASGIGAIGYWRRKKNI